MLTSKTGHQLFTASALLLLLVSFAPFGQGSKSISWNMQSSKTRMFRTGIFSAFFVRGGEIREVRWAALQTISVKDYLSRDIYLLFDENL